MKDKKKAPTQNMSSEIDSWVLAEAELHGVFESFPRESLDIILNKTIKRLKKKSTVLDVGCGTGFFGFEITRLGHKVFGIDASKNIIDYAKTKKKANSNSVLLTLGNAEQLPFKEGSFDVCFCGVILHHLPDIYKISKEMFRVLKKDGFIFGVEPNNNNWHVSLSMSPASPFRYDKNTSNERALPPSELIDVLEKRLGMQLNIDYQHLKMPHEGSIGFWDLPIIYKIIGFIIKKIKGFYRRIFAILIFNIIHIIQKFQSIEKKANFLIFTAKKNDI